ncbi:MAG: hypothetical protein ACFB9M_17930 [Myxococcota bacterium]
MRRDGLSWVLCCTLLACSPKVHTTEEVLSKLDEYLGRKLVMEVELKSGARCRAVQDGVFKTYCRDCQYCRGPLVVVSDQKDSGADDWPLILGGVQNGRPIACEGPLNQIVCHPFVPGKRYVIRGSIEKVRPPKFIVMDFWESR